MKLQLQMYPYIEIFWITMHMTWIGIVVFILTFILVSYYLTNKYHQDFLKLFYWLPMMVILMYCFWSYFMFIFEYGLFPTNMSELAALAFPVNYTFSFAWVLFGFLVSNIIFFSKIKRLETKKVWIDIIFLSTTLALVPLWLFAVFGDTFVGKINEWWLSIKSLHPQSQLNKYNWVLPVGLFLSIWALFCSFAFVLFQRKYKKFGLWLLWFVVLLIWINLVFFFQQYPKNMPINIIWITFDIKHYMTFFVIMFLLYVNNIRNTKNW